MKPPKPNPNGRGAPVRFPEWMYLENSLRFGSESVKVDRAVQLSQGDVLANMMYFYLVFLLAVIAMGSIGFCIREYVVSVSLKTSPTSMIIRRANWTPESSASKQELECKTDPEQPTAPGLVQEKWHEQSHDEAVEMTFPDAESLSSLSSRGNDRREDFAPWYTRDVKRTVENLSTVEAITPQGKNNIVGYIENGNEQAGDSASDPDTLGVNFDKLRLLEVENNSPVFCDSSIAKFIIDYIPSSNENGPPLPTELKQQVNIKRVYTLKELFSIRNQIHSCLCELPTRVCQLGKNTIPITETRFDTYWHADRMVSDIRWCLLSKPGDSSKGAIALKTLKAMQFISISSTPQPMANPNLFLPQYNDLVETLIDTGAMFDILDKISDTAKVLIIDSIIIHFWSHLSFRYQDTELIGNAFSQLNSEPTIQSRKAIFRLFCNLRLGVHLMVGNQDMAQRVETQMSMFVTELVRMTECNEYISVFPMLAQAIDLSPDSQIKYVFYHMCHRIVALHSNCCIGICLDDDYLDIRAIVQHGMWNHQDPSIRDIATDTFEVLCQARPRVRRWQGELTSGLINPTSAVAGVDTLRLVRLRHLDPTAEETWAIGTTLRSSGGSSYRLRSKTPGSWDVGH